MKNALMDNDLNALDVEWLLGWFAYHMTPDLRAAICAELPMVYRRWQSDSGVASLPTEALQPGDTITVLRKGEVVVAKKDQDQKPSRRKAKADSAKVEKAAKEAGERAASCADKKYKLRLTALETERDGHQHAAGLLKGAMARLLLSFAGGTPDPQAAGYARYINSKCLQVAEVTVRPSKAELKEGANA